MKNLNTYRDQAYKTACEHGFHDEERSIEHLKCLIVSELMEAVEADRKSYNADMDAFDKYEGLISFDENFERHVKDTVADELADACIRIFDLAGYKNIDLDIESRKTPVIVPVGTFTEKIYDVVHVLVGCEQLNRCLTLTLMRIFLLAEGMGIDIGKHIQLKMEYNASRPYKHGKKY
jgi:NTP pyrophosphatase (non-canonical NTP hydrolase)